MISYQSVSAKAHKLDNNFKLHIFIQTTQLLSELYVLCRTTL